MQEQLPRLDRLEPGLSSMSLNIQPMSISKKVQLFLAGCGWTCVRWCDAEVCFFTQCFFFLVLGKS